MQEQTIERVLFARIPHSDGEIVRVIFSYTGETDDDVFEFDEPDDINYILTMISYSMAPEQLMVAIRDKAEITVH